MTMEETVKRINELARKAKAEGLSEEEIKERAVLREKYIAAVRKNLTAQLEQTYLVEPDGTKHKLGKRSEGDKVE